MFVQRGNVKADIEVTYEYGVTKGKSARVPPIIRDGRAHLPVQLQMEYTAVDGARIMRVFTRAMPTTNNRKTAEDGRYHTTAHSTSRMQFEGGFFFSL